MFATWGLPHELVTDCGSQFVSSEFQTFLKTWKINHKTSSPYHHQSNGKAESAVKIMKNLIKKAKENNEDPFVALMELRNTPRQYVERSPAQMMLGRKPRTFLPQKPDKASVPKSQSVRQESVKKHYDKSAKDLKPLEVGSPVYFRTPQNKWGAGKVVSKNDRKYKVLSEDGTIYIRNRVHLNKKYSPFDNALEILTSPSITPEPESDRQQHVKPARMRKRPMWHEDFVRH